MNILLVDTDGGVGVDLQESVDGITVDRVDDVAAASRRLEETSVDAVVSVTDRTDVARDIEERLQAGADRPMPFVRLPNQRDSAAAMTALRLSAERLLDGHGKSPGDERPPPADDGALRDIVKRADDPILVLRETTVWECNDAVANILGYQSPAALRGTPVAELSPPTQPDGRASYVKAVEMVEQAAEMGHHRFEWVHRRVTGEEILFAVSLTPIVHEGTRLLYCVWEELGGRQDFAPAELPRPTGPTGEPSVLAIDAEGGRGSTTRSLKQAGGLTVRTVGTPNVALQTLLEDDAIDSLVTDHRPPGLDGVETVETLREQFPILPIVVILPEPDDTVTTDAVAAGASDVVVRSESGRQLADRLRAVVRQARLQHGALAHIERSQAMLERLPLPTVLFQRRYVEACNRAFAELIGRDVTRRGDRPLATAIVHPGDRDRFGRLLDEWSAGTRGVSEHELRIVRPDETIRHCAVAGRPLEGDRERGVMVSFRDVTEHTRQVEMLERERELYGTVPARLIDARTREAVEHAAVDTLYEVGYALACICTTEDDKLTLQAARRDDSYLSARDPTVEATHSRSEPGVWAASTGEPQYVENLQTLLPADWREAALDAGFRSGGGIPLTYNGIRYGVLSVYASQPGRFDEHERTILERFADVVAFAIHAADLETSRAGDTRAEVDLSLEAEGYYLVDLIREGTVEGPIRALETVPREDDEVLQYVTITADRSAAAAKAALETHPAVTDALRIPGTDPARFQVIADGPVPEAVLAEPGVLVTETTVSSAGVALSFEAAVTQDLEVLTDRLAETFGRTTVELMLTHEEGPDGWPDRFRRAELTDKQATALRAAYHHGYFDQPRGHSAEEIAETLGVSHARFLEHLHRAQQKLLAAHLE